MPTVVVEGKDFLLDEKQAGLMLYIQEAEAIQGGQNIPITNITEQTFTFILEILKTLNYDIKEPPHVKSAVLEDFVDKELVKLIGGLNVNEINNLYRAAHYLKITPLRKCISAVIASRVFIQPTLDDYNKKKTELKLVKELNTQISKSFKERFPFMN